MSRATLPPFPTPSNHYHLFNFPPLPVVWIIQGSPNVQLVAPVNDMVNDAAPQVPSMMVILLPASEQVSSPASGTVVPDAFEIPLGSGIFYFVVDVQDRYLGFPGHHLRALAMPEATPAPRPLTTPGVVYPPNIGPSNPVTLPYPNRQWPLV